MLAAEQAPLSRQIGTFSRSLGVSSQNLNMALGNVGRRMGFAQNQQERDLQPFKLKLQMVSDQSARAITGFTADRQSKLDLMLNRLNRQEQLTDRDWKEATDLAKEERTYKRERKNSLEDMYRQYGLQPDSQKLSPLGEYLKQQKAQDFQNQMTLKKTSSAGGQQPLASQREYEYLKSQGFSNDQAAQAAFGVEKKGNDAFDSYINDEMQRTIDQSNMERAGYTGPAGPPSIGDIFRNIF